MNVMITKYSNRIFSLICAASLALGFNACDDEYNGMDNGGEVKILSFVTGNEKLSTIDEATGAVQLVFPSGMDLTRLSPQITLSEGARIGSPSNATGPIDLSKLTTYRIINGNLYHDYTVQAFHVAGITRIASFSIGKYKGSINHEERTVTLPYPMNEPLDHLTPSLTLNEGATLVSPAKLEGMDFTRPVDFTITYLDETFTYTVTVVPTDMSPKGFLGSAESANDLTNASEKAAWNWLQENYDGCEYISFKAIKEGKDLSQFGALWYHWDSFGKGGDPSVADDANQPEVIQALNDFLDSGKGLFLSSAGMALGKVLDISKDGNMWNNAWGFDASPFKVDDGNGIGWGIRFIDHPIFRNVRKPAGETNRCFLLSNGCETYGRNVRWNFKADWTPQYMGRDKWMEANGGKQLATLHWDDRMEETSVFTEYEGKNGKGTVITCGAECYDWHDATNTYRDNMETITSNILNYISK